MKAKDLPQHIEAFREFSEAKGLAPSTIRNYENILRFFLRWFIGEFGEQADVTGRRIRGYLAQKHREGKTPKTVQTYWATIHNFFAFLVLDEVIPENQDPMRLVKPPRCPVPEIRPLTKEEAHLFLESFSKHYPPERRNYVMVALMMDSGLRVGEVVRLKISDIDLESGRVNVMGKGAKPRIAYVGQVMRRVLKDYLEHGRPGLRRDECKSVDNLFPPSRSNGKTMDTCHISTIVKQKMEEVGIYRSGSLAAHRLRHTFATNYLRNGGDVFSLQKLLGHSDLEMTRRYCTLNDEDVQAAHAKASPLDALKL